MKKLVREFTFDDLSRYGNLRACDGNWSFMLASSFIDFYHHVPKSIFKKKRNTFVKQHINQLFNLEDYPNMKIDIESGDVELQ